VLLTGCTSGTSQRAAEPVSTPTSPADVILVHGAWHNSACWPKVVPLLAESGRRAIAVDLPGHGVSARFPAAYLQPGQPGLAEEVSPLRVVILNEFS
jgi:alpha-beta hydrolase superfamily lysophospholipase